MMSTELVHVENGTEHGSELDLATARAEIGGLVSDGDTDTLADVAHVAKLTQLHEKRMENQARANEAGRLKVEAEAGIGLIDIRLNPKSWALKAPLIIKGAEVSKNRRADWRSLGYAHLQKLLDDVLASLEDDDRGVSTSAAVASVRAAGAGRWAADPLRRAFESVRVRGCVHLRAIHHRAAHLEGLLGRGEKSSSELVKLTGWSYNDVRAALRELQLNGRAQPTGERRKPIPVYPGCRRSPVWRWVPHEKGPLRAGALTVSEVAEQTGLDRGTVLYVLQKSGATRTVQYDVGIELARALGAEGQLRPAPLSRSSLSAAERRRRRRAAMQRNERLNIWRAREEAMRARGGKIAEMYGLVRRAEQMSSACRDALDNRDAKADLDSAVLDLMEAATKLHRAAMLG